MVDENGISSSGNQSKAIKSLETPKRGEDTKAFLQAGLAFLESLERNNLTSATIPDAFKLFSLDKEGGRRLLTSFKGQFQVIYTPRDDQQDGHLYPDGVVSIIMGIERWLTAEYTTKFGTEYKHEQLENLHRVVWPKLTSATDYKDAVGENGKRKEPIA